MMTLEVFKDDIVALEKGMQICVPNNNLPNALPNYWNQEFSDNAAFLPNCYAYANNLAPIKFFPQHNPMFFCAPGVIGFWRTAISNDNVKDKTDAYLNFLRQADPYIRGEIFDYAEYIVRNLTADGLTYLGYKFSLASHGSTLALFLHDKADISPHLQWKGELCHQNDYHLSAIRCHESKITWAEKRLGNHLSLTSPRGIFEAAAHFSYYYFAGYFHCPNDLGFPSVG